MTMQKPTAKQIKAKLKEAQKQADYTLRTTLASVDYISGVLHTLSWIADGCEADEPFRNE